MVDHETFYKEFIVSASAFVPADIQSKLRTAKLLIAGSGGIGNPIAMAAARSGAENITILDPDTIEISNLPRQEYLFSQLGKNKAECTVENILAFNPFPKETIRGVSTGLTKENSQQLVSEADIIVDAIDVRALDVVYELHKQAAKYKKPVLVGYDLAGTAMIVTYRYDKKDLLPFEGELTEEIIKMFLKVEEAVKAGKITDAEFLNYIYDAFTGPISPPTVPMEQLIEIVNRTKDANRTYQLGTTSRVLSGLAVESFRRILGNEEIKNITYTDLPTLVRKNNPSKFTKTLYLRKVLGKIRKRAISVKETIAKIG